MKHKDEVNIKGKHLHHIEKRESFFRQEPNKQKYFSPNHHAHHQQRKDVTKHLKDGLLPAPTVLLICLDALSQVDSLRLPDFQTHPEHAWLS